MTPDLIARQLSRTAPFATLAPAALEALAGIAEVRSYRKNRFVFQHGDPSDAIYVIVEGFVKVLVTSPEGAEMLFCTLGADECFGELSYLDGKPRSATVETVTPTRLIVLTRSVTDAVLDAHPAIARALLVYLCGMVRRLSERAADLVFLDLDGRLAKCLDRLAEEKGVVEPDGVRLDLNMTQSDLASLVGASRTSVNQALQTFARRGFLRTQGRTILITDLAGLRRRHQR